MIKLNINKTGEEAKNLVKLMQLMAKDGETGAKAKEAVAAFVGPVITQVLEQKATHRAFYTKYNYNFGESPTIPLDNFEANEEGLIDVWTCSSTPLGLATNHVSGADEFKMTTFGYQSAFSMLRQNAEKGRFDTLVSGMERMANEVMVKEKFQAWGTMLRALGAARSGASSTVHGIEATAAGVFQLDDINRLKTKLARVRTSWIGGTPAAATGAGLTHLVVSPEIMEQIRGWVYNPQNTRVGTMTTSGATAIALPDAIRMSIFNDSGLISIPGVGNFIQLQEMGVGQAYNSIFDSGYTAGVGDPAFAGASQEIILGVDLSVDAGVQLSAIDSERTTEFKVQEDDQFTKRSGRFGFFGESETGFAWLDTKSLSFVIV